MTVTHAIPTVFDHAAIDALPRVAIDGVDGVTSTVLWRNATSMAGVLTVEAGHSLGTHAHRWNHHHLWVVDGVGRIAGVVLGAGAYVHVPAGVGHDIVASEEQRCRVFYVYESRA